MISLGDGFHDPPASTRLSSPDRDRLRSLTKTHDWLWIRGNHDPDLPDDLGGRCEASAQIRGLTFRHCPSPGSVGGEVAGHLHPKASVTVRGRRVSRPCFVGDRSRALLPAFGSYAGGLDVRAPAIARLFTNGCAIRLIGKGRVYLVAHALVSELGAGALAPVRCRRGFP